MSTAPSPPPVPPAPHRRRRFPPGRQARAPVLEPRGSGRDDAPARAEDHAGPSRSRRKARRSRHARAPLSGRLGRRVRDGRRPDASRRRAAAGVRGRSVAAAGDRDDPQDGVPAARGAGTVEAAPARAMPPAPPHPDPLPGPGRGEAFPWLPISMICPRLAADRLVARPWLRSGRAVGADADPAPLRARPGSSAIRRSRRTGRASPSPGTGAAAKRCRSTCSSSTPGRRCG